MWLFLQSVAIYVIMMPMIPDEIFTHCYDPAFPSDTCGDSACLGLCSDNSAECLSDADCRNGSFCDSFATRTSSCTNPDMNIPITFPAHCDNSQKDPGETDIDCGGECASCVQGEKCDEDDDCVTNMCQVEDPEDGGSSDEEDKGGKGGISDPDVCNNGKRDR